MPKFKVYLDEIVTYEVEVEAEDEDEARDLAEYRFVEEGCTKFPVEVHEREVGSIEWIPESTQQPED